MLLKYIYETITISLCVPILAWNAIISLIMWDIKYWDNACHQVDNLINLKS
jgi:hypothetical protein